MVGGGKGAPHAAFINFIYGGNNGDNLSSVGPGTLNSSDAAL